MFTVFEGSEKMCEVIMSDGSVDLRSLGDAFWSGLVCVLGNDSLLHTQ